MSAAPAVFSRIAVACTGPAVEEDLLEFAALLSRGDPPARVMVAAVPAEPVIRGVMPAARSVFHGRSAPALSFQLLMERDLDAVFDAARDFSAQLLVVRHPREVPDGRRMAGRLLSEAPCSVCLAPANRTLRIRRVLAGIELTEGGRALLGSAAALCRRSGVEELIALHACFRDSIVDDEAIERRFREEMTLALYRFMARAPVGGINCTPVLEDCARYGRALLRAAERYSPDLIVVGRGSGRESSELLWESPAPVLYARLEAQPLSFREAWKRRWFSTPEPRFN
jgi:hypothetical protein